MARYRDNLPSLLRLRNIPHYYGDHARQLFVATAVVSVVSIPILGALLPFGTLTQVVCAVVLVVLAGLTTPHNRTVMLYNTLVAALGVVLLESAAISLYSSQEQGLFLVREAGVVMLVFALYFSVKTLRAMSQGKLGKLNRPWEFEETDETPK